MTEKHHLFPSGEWEGFYTYSWSPQRHKMAFQLHFEGGQVTGSGVDDIAPFHWEGVYNTERMKCDMTKFYPAHAVFYDGHVDENGIWGTWNIRPMWRGGFHIWPKSAGESNEEEEEEVSAREVSVATFHSFELASPDAATVYKYLLLGIATFPLRRRRRKGKTSPPPLRLCLR